MHTWLLVIVFATGQQGLYTGEVGSKTPYKFKTIESCESVMNSEGERLSKEVPVPFEMACIEQEGDKNGTSA